MLMLPPPPLLLPLVTVTTLPSGERSVSTATEEGHAGTAWILLLVPLALEEEEMEGQASRSLSSIITWSQPLVLVVLLLLLVVLLD